MQQVVPRAYSVPAALLRQSAHVAIARVTLPVKALKAVAGVREAQRRVSEND
jgi:hypothetical protein